VSLVSVVVVVLGAGERATRLTNHTLLSVALTAYSTDSGSWPLLVIIIKSMETPITLFPNVSEFRLDSVEQDDVHRALTFVVTSIAKAAAWPDCGQPSHRYLQQSFHLTNIR